MALADKLIEQGRQAYGSKNYSQALIHFTRAANACECNRGKRRERCKCKNFEQVVLKNESVFKEAMENCNCLVSKTFGECYVLSHIKALDYRAGVYEKMGHLDRAQRDAEWILEIAPRALEVGIYLFLSFSSSGT
jgi:F-box/TPR repeat protein Pof3